MVLSRHLHGCHDNIEMSFKMPFFKCLYSYFYSKVPETSSEKVARHFMPISEVCFIKGRNVLLLGGMGENMSENEEKPGKFCTVSPHE